MALMADLKQNLLSIRTRLFLVILAVFVPLLAFSMLLAANYASTGRQVAEAQRAAVANDLALILDGEMTSLRRLLTQLAGSAELRKTDFEGFRHLAEATASAGHVDQILVVGPDLRVQFSTGSPTPAPAAELAPAPFLQKALNGKVEVSDVLAGREGQPLHVQIALPVIKNGEIEHVIVGAVNLSFLNGIFATAGVRQGWIAAIVDRNGHLLATSGNTQGVPGKPASPAVNAMAQESARTGTVKRAELNGMNVAASWARSANSGWTAVVAIPIDVLEAPLQRSLAAISLLGFVLAAFGVGLASYIATRISGQIRQLSASAIALVDGKPLPPVDEQAEEFFEVAKAFSYAEAVVQARKMSEERVRQSERQLRLVLNSLSTSVGVLDLDGNLIELNDAPIKAAGIDRQDVIRTPLWECYWWSYSPSVQAQIKEAFERARKGETVRFDVDMRVKDGALMACDFQIAPIIVAGRVVQLIPSATDISERKRAERRMAESETRFRSIFENSAIGSAQVGLDGHWIMVNDRMCEILGYGREELSQMNFKEVTHPEDVDHDVAMRQRLLSGEVPTFTLTKRYLRKDGVAIWVDLTASLVRNSNGVPQYIIAVINDVTERLRAELALKAAEERERLRREELETLLQSMPAAIFIAEDPSCEHIKINRLGHELLEMAPKTDIWVKEPGVEEPDHVEIWAEGHKLALHEMPIQRAAATGTAILDTEVELKFKHGRSKYLLGNALPIFDAAQRVRGAIGAFVDITERKQAEKTLRASELRLRRLHDANIIGIVTSDSERIIEANKVFLDLIGYSEQELRAGLIDWRKITPPEYAGADQTSVEQVRTLGWSEPFEKEYIRKDGTRVPILIGAAMIESEPLRWISYIVDLTERKQAENHIRFLMRELSHRSKNLLAVIQAMASQTARSASSVQEFQVRFGARIQGLAASHDLLAHQNWQGVSIGELVRRQLATFVDASDPRVKMSGPRVTFTAEAGQNLGLALHELATNAVKYGALSALSGEINISWRVQFNGGQPTKFLMSWVERGGPVVTPPSRKGFGHVVIDRMLSAALEGKVKLEFPPEGLCWHLEVPITGVTKILSVEEASKAA